MPLKHALKNDALGGRLGSPNVGADSELMSWATLLKIHT